MKKNKFVLSIVFIMLTLFLFSCWEKKDEPVVENNNNNKIEKSVEETEEIVLINEDEILEKDEIQDPWTIDTWTWENEILLEEEVQDPLSIDSWNENILNTWSTEVLSTTETDLESQEIIEDKENKEEKLRQEEEKKAEKIRILKEKKDWENYELANSKSDKKYCDKIYNENLKNSCKDQFLITELQTSTNENDCDVISDEYQRGLCKDNILQKNLMSSIKGDVIDNVEDTSNGTVQVINKSTFEDKIKLCDKMSEPEIQLWCKNNLYYAQALEDLDNELCNKIMENDYDVSKCIKKVEILKRRN